jgi:hypothetical protein
MNGTPKRRSLQELYPTLSPDELRVASENIDRYLRVVLRICKRLEAEQEGSDSLDSDYEPPNSWKI